MKHISTSTPLLTGLLGVLLLAAQTAAAQPPPDFARIDTDAGGRPRALQVAIVRYQDARRANPVSVDLISAVHIADKGYFAALNERFRDYDAVLFELVIANPEDGNNNPGDGESFLTSLQINMKDALDLTFQLEEIDYGAPNFVHADFSAEMLQASMEERGESLYVYFWRLFYSAIDDYARDPLGLQNMQLMSMLVDETEEDVMKVALAYEMVRATRIGDLLGNEQGSAIIAARNEHAIKVLRQQITDGARRIAIFYGAAHMVDFDRRLVTELDLEAGASEWLDAWQFRRSVTEQ